MWIINKNINNRYIFDLSNPSNLIKIGQFNDGSGACSLQIIGETAYVAGYASGLEILDISEPTTPTKLGQFYDDAGESVSVCVIDNHAYVADRKEKQSGYLGGSK